MSKLQIQWTAHADFERMLSEVFQDDPIEGIKELVANGFDADASRFDITYRPNKGILIAKDNGSGMGEHELRQGFYRSGDSLTKKAGKTKLGRNPMGNYGIGTIVMQYLARSYTLETWRDGQKLTIEEEFIEGQRPRKVLSATPETCDSSLHGTLITINPMRFSQDEVSLEQLTRRLALGINVQSRLEPEDQFDVYVNGQKAELKNQTPALVFAINKHDDMIGQVHGRVNFYDRAPPYRGVIVRVNGRQVGSEDYFDNLMPNIMRGRIYADIDVDLMASRISFSRARFQEDSPHFGRLTAILEESFKSLRPEVDHYTKEKVMVKGKSAVERALSNAVDRIGDIRIRNARARNRPASLVMSARNSTANESGLGDILLSADSTGGYKVALVSEQPHSFGAVDHKAGILSVNISHPYFTVPSVFPEKGIQAKILYAMCHILGRDELASKSSKYAEAFRARDEAMWRLSQQVFSGQPRLLDALMENRTGYSRRGVSPDRMYSTSELFQESPLAKQWLHKFKEAGLLRPTIVADAEERYYGANVILALERLKGGTPAFQLVKDFADAEKSDVTRARVDQMIHEVDGRIAGLITRLPYVFNISLTDNPLYVIMPGYETNFTQLYKSGHIKARHIIPPELTISGGIVAAAGKNPAVGIEGTVSWNYSQLVAQRHLHPGLSEQEIQGARAYNAIDTYTTGDIVLHESYGFGKVLSTVNKACTVQFKGNKLSMAHNR